MSSFRAKDAVLIPLFALAALPTSHLVVTARVESASDPSVPVVSEMQNAQFEDANFSIDGDVTSESEKMSLGQNLLPNPKFEQGTGDLPRYWNQGGYGTNEREFTYPAEGVGGTKGAETSITSYTDGDTDWYPDPLVLDAGTYRYVDHYRSDVPSVIELQIENADGSYTWTDLKQLPAASAYTAAKAYFTVPAGAQNAIVYHLISGVGSLSIDNVTVRKESEGTGIFATGGITLRFDDGWQSQYDLAVPALDAAGLKGTFYIVTHQTGDQGYSGFMTIPEVQELAAKGEEVGAHTRTHPHLPQLTYAEQQDEILGSKQDLESWGIEPASFAYPYGQHNEDTLAIVRSAFTDAAGTGSGDNVPTTPKYRLRGYSVVLSDTPEKIESMIQNAVAQKDWLVLTFHRIDTSGDEYSITPENFAAIMGYIAQNAVPTATISEGVADM